jgi:hypothetical protein
MRTATRKGSTGNSTELSKYSPTSPWDVRGSNLPRTSFQDKRDKTGWTERSHDYAKYSDRPDPLYYDVTTKDEHWARLVEFKDVCHPPPTPPPPNRKRHKKTPTQNIRSEILSAHSMHKTAQFCQNETSRPLSVSHAPVAMCVQPKKSPAQSMPHMHTPQQPQPHSHTAHKHTPRPMLTGIHAAPSPPHISLTHQLGAVG